MGNNLLKLRKELSFDHRDKKTLEKYYINTRLNKSLDSYYSDLKTSLSYLNNRKSENIIKNL